MAFGMKIKDLFSPEKRLQKEVDREEKRLGKERELDRLSGIRLRQLKEQRQIDRRKEEVRQEKTKAFDRRMKSFAAPFESVSMVASKLDILGDAPRRSKKGKKRKDDFGSLF